MHVSALSSTSSPQAIAQVATAVQTPSATGQISPISQDPSQTTLSPLRSPAQMFSPDNLDALVSDQSEAVGVAAEPAQSATLHIRHHDHHFDMQTLNDAPARTGAGADVEQLGGETDAS